MWPCIITWTCIHLGSATVRSLCVRGEARRAGPSTFSLAREGTWIKRLLYLHINLPACSGVNIRQVTSHGSSVWEDLNVLVTTFSVDVMGCTRSRMQIAPRWGVSPALLTHPSWLQTSRLCTLELCIRPICTLSACLNSALQPEPSTPAREFINCMSRYL